MVNLKKENFTVHNQLDIPLSPFVFTLSCYDNFVIPETFLDALGKKCDIKFHERDNLLLLTNSSPWGDTHTVNEPTLTAVWSTLH